MPPEPMTTLNVPAFSRVTDYAGLWSIEPQRAAMLIANAKNTDLKKHVAESDSPKLKSDLQIQAMPNGQKIGVVMLTDTLMKSVSSMDGGTSTVQARRDIRAAANDPNIGAIMLMIDSPGGTVAGTADLAAEVKAATKSKPVMAFVSDLCASAAYWVASQADYVYANDRTALVGSIGTLVVVYDQSEAAAKDGIKTLVFGTGPLKGAATPGSAITEDQQNYFAQMVESSQTSFDQAVQKGRDMTDKQLATARTGGVFLADEAVGMKLIDGIKTQDQAFSELAAMAKRAVRSQNQPRVENPLPLRSMQMKVETEQTAGDETPSVNLANDAVASIRAAAAAETGRIASIQRLCAKTPDIAAKAIAEGWVVEKAELESMRAQLPTGVNAVNPGSNTSFVFGGQKMASDVNVNDAIECSMLATMGRRDYEKLYSANTCEAARKNFRNVSLQQVLMMAASQNGYHARAGERINQGNIREVMRAAFNPQDGGGLMASTSTIAVSGILGNIANKEILAGYTEEDTNWMSIATIKSVQNFQVHTSYRMLENFEYEELGPDGKIKHGTAGQESYTRQAKTYAKMFALTRTDIINDDLGAFGDVRSRLGRGQAIKFNKIFWASFVNNSSFFTSARTNYISGGTTNLGTDGVGLQKGVQQFRQMRSPSGTAPASDDAKKNINASSNGSRMGGTPTVILVPPELEVPARKLYAGEFLNVGTAAGEPNVFRGLFNPVVATQLSDSTFTGYSATAWYLFRDPGILAPMVVSFLNGNMAPTVESSDADFSELGIQFRGYHDFGCDQAEYLAGVKSAGA